MNIEVARVSSIKVLCESPPASKHSFATCWTVMLLRSPDSFGNVLDESIWSHIVAKEEMLKKKTVVIIGIEICAKSCPHLNFGQSHVQPTSASPHL